MASTESGSRSLPSPATEPPPGPDTVLGEPGLTREQRRSRRRHKVRARSISTTRLPRWELELGKRLFPLDEHSWKPRTREECAAVSRPCPYVSCKFNLYLDVNARTGSIKVNFPDLEVDQMPESCALDVADRGGASLEDVGAAMNLTRERVRQLERSAMAKIEAVTDTFALRDFVEGSRASAAPKGPLSADDFLDTADDAGEAADGQVDDGDSIEADG